MKKISDKSRYQILNYKLNLRRVNEIFAEFDKNGISPILIKGLAAAINYPRPFQRVFSDIDLAVDPNHYEAARKIIEENAFNIDLHKGLRHLDVVVWKNLYENSFLTELEGVRFRILRPEDHLRVLCVHWLNDGGADRTRLWDIYFAVNNRPEDFSWERFLEVVHDKRKRWLMTVLLLAKKYLGADLGTGFPGFGEYVLPEWIELEVEKEWSNDFRLIPLEQVLNDRKQLLKQIRKRIPPNGLQAVVENDEILEEKSKLSVRLENGLKRIKPLIDRILNKDRDR